MSITSYAKQAASTNTVTSFEMLPTLSGRIAPSSACFYLICLSLGPGDLPWPDNDTNGR
uniref:Uncharacterized protein n=1 Tax=Arundo donax TaxID=35708 RepID=A0A0A9DPL3_ARUDO